MFGHFLYCRLAACLAAFLFCVLCCLGLFSVPLALTHLHTRFYCMHWCIFLLTTRWDLLQQAKDVLLLAGFWAGFNLAKYATKCCLFHSVHWPAWLAAWLLVSCFFAFILACFLVHKLWLNDSLAPKSGTWTLNSIFFFSFRIKIWQ